MQGGVIDKFMPVSVSSVAIVCNNCGPSRIGMRIDETGRKLRVCKKCGGDL
jgi:large subunit ribosomal protein L24